ncbi:peptidoglycan editing factor PgeF, partial [Candidatus Gracilibacteria bacterium]|nr:peptidoglycan editing factor PgeF [Candidatus Gracilibacteria bacterium]
IEITEDNLSDTLYADACFTRLNDISLNVVVADCVPILLYDRVQNVVGVIHAGWRGSAGKILEKTLSFLQETHTSKMEDVIIFIGPSISQEYYEIGSEVAELFSESIIQSDGKYFLDIKGENLRQALAYGVLRENIELSHECTYKLSEKYFSYRRERIKANFVCGIGLKTH